MYYARDYRSMARQSLTGKWGLSIVACLISLILGGLYSNNQIKFTYNSNSGGYVEVFGVPVTEPTLSGGLFAFASAAILGIGLVALLQFVIGGAIQLGTNLYFLKLGQNMKAELSDLFYYFRYILKAFGLRFVTAIFVMLWSLLLIIPGIIAGYRYALAPYILAENPEMGILEAIDQSKQMMIGYKLSLFCLQFSFIGWAILCAFTLGLGTLVLNPYTQMATTHFYLVRKNDYFRNSASI